MLKSFIYQQGRTLLTIRNESLEEANRILKIQVFNPELWTLKK
jgi:hypothetical protein